jgi:IS1 family transposase
MDAYQVRTWEGWYHHMALTLMAVWFLIRETHRGQQLTPALTLPHVRYGLSMRLLEVFCTPNEIDVGIQRVEEVAVDEMWSFVGKERAPRWLWHAMEHRSGYVLAYVLGRRKDEGFLTLKALLEPFGITRY